MGDITISYINNLLYKYLIVDHAKHENNRVFKKREEKEAIDDACISVSSF